jgi:hypothetical protein
MPIFFVRSGRQNSSRAAAGSGAAKIPRYVRDDKARRELVARGLQRTFTSDSRPRASKRTPSRSSRSRWVSSAPGTGLRLQPPVAFTTRCHGTAVPDGKACKA